MYIYRHNSFIFLKIKKQTNMAFPCLKSHRRCETFLEKSTSVGHSPKSHTYTKGKIIGK